MVTKTPYACRVKIVDGVNRQLVSLIGPLLSLYAQSDIKDPNI
jgi:hypothetical protein